MYIYILSIYKYIYIYISICIYIYIYICIYILSIYNTIKLFNVYTSYKTCYEFVFTIIGC